MAFKAGAARVVITPPVGVELTGYGFGPSVGILDDLEAQALVLEQRAEVMVIVTADLLLVGADLVAGVRRRVQEALGIPGERVLLAASHTHSGPAAAPLRQWGVMDADYLRNLESQLVGLVGLAQRNLQEARLGVGLGRLENISENRRRRGGPIDPEVPVLRVDNRQGEPLALLFNFGCHPVSLHSYRNLISPDYPGYARAVIRGVLGLNVVALFALGAAGDSNPAGYAAGQTTPRRSRQIGAILGCEVARVALGLETRQDPELRVKRTMVELPVAPLPPEAELRAFHEQFAAQAARWRAEGRPFAEVSVAEIKRDWARDALAAWAAGATQGSRPCEIQGIRLGGAALVSMPLEVFAETSLAIKQGSPASPTFLCSATNAALGYLPTREVYEVEDYTNPQGLAPKVYGLYAFASGAEPLARGTANELLRSLF